MAIEARLAVYPEAVLEISAADWSTGVAEPEWQSVDPASHLDLIKRAFVWAQAKTTGAVAGGEIESPRLARLISHPGHTDPDVVSEVWSEVGDQVESLINRNLVKLQVAKWSFGGGAAIKIYRLSAFAYLPPPSLQPLAVSPDPERFPGQSLWNIYIDESDAPDAWDQWKSYTKDSLQLISIESRSYAIQFLGPDTKLVPIIRRDFDRVTAIRVGPSICRIHRK